MTLPNHWITDCGGSLSNGFSLSLNPQLWRVIGLSVWLIIGSSIVENHCVTGLGYHRILFVQNHEVMGLGYH